MRITVYAGVSVGLAGAAVLRALHERPNFYSAGVYLSQSNACRMILLNFLLFSVGSLMVGLQRLLYGALRPTEIEQLWDKSWYAVTETALAMTTFRDDVGSWFFIMFVSLLAGKVWSWIAEGRLETLEQQPPQNPRLFHTRLLASLLLSEAFAWYMLRYCVRTVLDEPRPGMMVMFAFEFAILLIMTTSLSARYALSLLELFIHQRQTAAKVEERKQEIRSQREAAQREADSNGTPIPDDLPEEDDIDMNEIDVPGWQEKGRWIFCLELCTDFFKLVVYLGFFTMLMLFHGIPIHILRDVFLTMRSFIKRILDFIKYRNATRDMNARFPDATVEELQRDGTCIVCREDMRPWEQPDAAPVNGAPRRATVPTDQRQRAKKLPCGHILHFGCLKSWLERQQVCPTCRRSVLAPPNGASSINNTNGNFPNQPPAAQVRQDANPQAPARPHDNNQPPRRNQPRARTFALGPVRITFAAGNHEQVQNALQHAGLIAPQNNQDTARGIQEESRFGGSGSGSNQSWQDQLAGVERQITQEIATLNSSLDQLSVVRALQGELIRLRAQQGQGNNVNGMQPNLPGIQTAGGLEHFPHPLGLPIPPGQQEFDPLTRVINHPRIDSAMPAQPLMFQSHQQVFQSHQTPMGPGHPQLPPGLTLPDGWTLMPLRRADQIGRSQLINGAVPSPPRTNSSRVQINANFPLAVASVVQVPPANMPSAAMDLPLQPPASDSTVVHAQEVFDALQQPNTAPSEQANTISDAPIPTSETLPDWSSTVAPVPLENPSPAPHTNGEPLSAAAAVSQAVVDQPDTPVTQNGEAAAGRGKARAATVSDEADEDA